MIRKNTTKRREKQRNLSETRNHTKGFSTVFHLSPNTKVVVGSCSWETDGKGHNTTTKVINNNNN